ncbi:MAG: hypothetical protein PHH09_04055 [Methanoregulaceae archaeon]|nr:hypothetical protein [Methanoregulaceae archaeon]
MAQAWTDEETALLKECNSRQEAKQRYLERFPDSTRLSATVGRRFYDVRPDKREPKWSDAEKAPILAAETVESAIAEYQQLFPKSTRSVAAIRREWYELQPEKRHLISCGRKKGGRNKAPHPGTAREKYCIPFSTKQNKKGYNHAVYICKKYDLPYAEALDREKQEALSNLQEKTVKKEKAPRECRVPKEKTPRKTRVKKPRQVQVKPQRPVRPEPELIRCVRCGSPISPADFEYTEQTGLCIPCWEDTDEVEDLPADLVRQVAGAVT